MTLERDAGTWSSTWLSSSVNHEDMEITSFVIWRNKNIHWSAKEKSLVNIPEAKALKIYITFM